MSLKPKVKDTWTRKNGLITAGILSNVGTEMLNNAAYPNPPHTPAAITAQGVVCLNAYNNRKADKDVYDSTLIDSCTMLTEVGEYVTLNCGEDVAKIHSAGFENTATERTPSVLPGQAVIKDLTSKNGNIVVQIIPMAGVEKYSIIAFVGAEAAVTLSNNKQINIAAGAAPISFIANATSHETLSGLPLGAGINIKVFAHNAAGTGPASITRSVFVQN